MEVQALVLGDSENTLEESTTKNHPLCKIEYDPWNGDHDCGYGATIACERCRFGPNGRGLDPRSKRNQV